MSRDAGSYGTEVVLPPGTLRRHVERLRSQGRRVGADLVRAANADMPVTARREYPLTDGGHVALKVDLIARRFREELARRERVGQRRSDGERSRASRPPMRTAHRPTLEVSWR
jgi:hypothetical protein